MRRLLTLACFLAMFGLVTDLRAGDEEYFEGRFPASHSPNGSSMCTTVAVFRNRSRSGAGPS